MPADITPNIYNAFATRLNAWLQAPPAPVAELLLLAGSVPLRVAYPGAPAGPFIPPETGMWLEVRFFPGATFTYSYGEEGPHVYQGTFQIAVCTRPGAGVLYALQLAGALVDLFPVAAPVAPARVQQRASVAPVIDEPDKCWIPVRVRYAASVATDFNPYLVLATGGGYETFDTTDAGPYEVI